MDLPSENSGLVSEVDSVMVCCLYVFDILVSNTTTFRGKYNVKTIRQYVVVF